MFSLTAESNYNEHMRSHLHEYAYKPNTFTFPTCTTLIRNLVVHLNSVKNDTGCSANLSAVEGEYYTEILLSWCLVLWCKLQDVDSYIEDPFQSLIAIDSLI